MKYQIIICQPLSGLGSYVVILYLTQSGNAIAKRQIIKLKAEPKKKSDLNFFRRWNNRPINHRMIIILWAKITIRMPGNHIKGFCLREK